MAEIAAGAVVAEEVVSTTVQGAAAGYAVAKPTMPLKATFKRIATAPDDQTRLSLARSDHTLSIVKDKAYIFGGETANGEVASNDMHSITLDPSPRPSYDYALIPAVPDLPSGPVPGPRTNHAACAFNVCVAIFGGTSPSGGLADPEPTVWLFNTSKSSWETLAPSSPPSTTSPHPRPRTSARLFNHLNTLVLHGGLSADGTPLSDLWILHYASRTWHAVDNAPIPSPRPSAAVASPGSLYLISSPDTTSGEVHSYCLPHPSAFETEYPFETRESWVSDPFPTNPLAPGPRARLDAGLVPVSTGHGRHYLLYFFGNRVEAKTGAATEPASEGDERPTQWVDLWTLQVGSEEVGVRPGDGVWASLAPARIKDRIRESLGFESGEGRWEEVEVMAPGELGEGEEGGKVHPGPRAGFGCDVMGDGRRVVFWGGVNAKGEREGDGWVIELE